MLGYVGYRAWLWGYCCSGDSMSTTTTSTAPVLLGLGAAAFWLVGIVQGMTAAELRAGGWLLGPFPSGSLLEPLRFGASLDHVAWEVLAEQLPEFATLVFVSVVTLLLSISSLEVVVAQDLDFDRELRWHGVANMLAGLVAGPPGFTSVSSWP